MFDLIVLFVVFVAGVLVGAFSHKELSKVAGTTVTTAVQDEVKKL
jgi:uncharacterized protein HemY